MTGTIRIGTRGSRLALWQAEQVRDALGQDSRIVVLVSEGDRRPDATAMGAEHTGFFTHEIDRALTEGAVDVAVHSLKDLPTEIEPTLVLAAFLPRGAASDLLVVDTRWLSDTGPLLLRQGCTVGTGSERRQALLECHAPQAHPVALRGNVPTRIERCREGRCGAVILARAGVERLALDLDGLAVFDLDPDVWLPAPGQGVIVASCRKDDARTRDLLAGLDHARTRSAARIERALLGSFEAGCTSAFGALARPEQGQWRVAVGRMVEERWVVSCRSGAEEELSRAGPASFPPWSPGETRSPVMREIRRA